MAPIGLDPSTLMFATGLLAFLTAGLSFITAKTLQSTHQGANEWGWAMATLGVTCGLWFLAPHAPRLLTFFIANSLAVLTGTFFLLAFYRLTSQGIPYKAGIALVLLGMSGIVATYYFDAPGSAAVFSITASHLVIVVMSGWSLVQDKRNHKSPYWWVTLSMLLLLGSAIAARIWATLFGHGAAAVSPVAPSNTRTFAIAAAILVSVAGSFGFFGILSERQRQQVLENSRRDALTGLYTRGAFFELARDVFAGGDNRCSLLMIDLDHFKRINDTYGHAAGDAVIRHAAHLIRHLIRSEDIAGRYGGEELCVLLPGCGNDEARDIAERIISDVAKQVVRLANGKAISYTTSLGYTSYEPNEYGAGQAPKLEELLNHADAALYQAKRSGRNRAQGASMIDSRRLH